MNFIQFVEKQFEMHANNFGCLAPASMLADWSPGPRTNVVSIVRVSIGDALTTLKFLWPSQTLLKIKSFVLAKSKPPPTRITIFAEGMSTEALNPKH